MPWPARMPQPTLILPQSEEMISLEDDLDDLMVMEEAGVAPPIASPLPVRSGELCARFSGLRLSSPTLWCSPERRPCLRPRGSVERGLSPPWIALGKVGILS